MNTSASENILAPADEVIQVQIALFSVLHRTVSKRRIKRLLVQFSDKQEPKERLEAIVKWTQKKQERKDRDRTSRENYALQHRSELRDLQSQGVVSRRRALALLMNNNGDVERSWQQFQNLRTRKRKLCESKDELIPNKLRPSKPIKQLAILPSPVAKPTCAINQTNAAKPTCAIYQTNFPASPFSLILDGNNVLALKVVQLSEAHVKSLVEQMKKFMTRLAGIDQIVIVLDGPERNLLASCSAEGETPLSVVFSHNREADDVIVDWQWRKQHPYVIVTADIQLAQRLLRKRQEGAADVAVMKTACFKDLVPLF
jgi:hypothetical protein